MNLRNPSPKAPRAVPALRLCAATAADLMTPNPTSIRDVATVREGLRTLVDRGFSAAPVIDHAGRPIGVLSRSDLLAHTRQGSCPREPVPEYYDRSVLTVDPGETPGWEHPADRDDLVQVGDVMTPVVFSVRPEDPVGRVVKDMVELKVHRLFVVDRDGVLVGVISALDVLRRLESSNA